MTGRVNNKKLREMALAALDAAGGEAWLRQQADTNPIAFMALLGKLEPKDVKLDATESFAAMVAKAGAARSLV